MNHDGKVSKADDIDQTMTTFRAALARMDVNPREAARIRNLANATDAQMAAEAKPETLRTPGIHFSGGPRRAARGWFADGITQPGCPKWRLQTPAQIIGELVAAHPEAASLLAEASHRQALARSSAANVGRAFAAAQAARLNYEKLGHRLDPRRRQTIHFGAGLIVLIVLGAGLTMLNVIDLSGLLGRIGSVLLVLAATAISLTGAWLAALASRERRRKLALTTIGAAILLDLVLTILPGFGPHPGWPTVREHVLGSSVFGVLVAGAAVLMAHMESASLFLARRRWHRARAAFEAAVQTEQADVQAALIAGETWLGLIRTRATAVAGGEEDLVHETVVLAAALLESGRPQPPSSRTP